MSRLPRYPLTVFYDHSCPLCAEEMHALKALDSLGRLELVDCSSAAFDDAGLIGDGLRRADLMARIHVRDRGGRWFVGIDAFEALYRAAGLERAARVWGDPRWRPAFRRLYPWIARNRQLLSRLGVTKLVRYLIPKPAKAPTSCRSCSLQE